MGRPKSQWIVGGITAACVLYALIIWAGQLIRVLTGCGDGLGNPGIAGRLTGEYCVLSDTEPLVRLPWHEDMWISALLVLSLAFVVAAVLAPRGSTRSRSLAVLAVPPLLIAGMTMGTRIARRGDDGELFSYFVDSAEGGGTRSVPDGWELSLSGRHVVIPDVGPVPIGIGLLGGLALVVLMVLLMRDTRRV